MIRRLHVINKWSVEGWNAARRGIPMTANPFDAGTVAANDWELGYCGFGLGYVP